MEMWRGKSTHAVPAVEDRERVALEMVQLYSRQQEVLRRTLQKHKQLEMVKARQLPCQCVTVCVPVCHCMYVSLCHYMCVCVTACV